MSLPVAGLAKAEEHTKDKVDQVLGAVKEKKAVLIDVREKKEWDRGHLKDAKLIPLSALKEGELKPEEVAKLLPKGTVVYCHCASGYRCLEAAPLLRKYGYDVRALSSGYKDLLHAGFVQAPEEKRAEEKRAEEKRAEEKRAEEKSSTEKPAPTK